MNAAQSTDYARVRRIVKTDEFSSVFRLRPTQRTTHFVLYTRPNELTHARLGVVAAKRFAPRAVTRNTIKRVARELFRQSVLPGIDCIVRLSQPVNTKQGPATTAALKTALRIELTKLFRASVAAAAMSVPVETPVATPSPASLSASNAAPAADAAGATDAALPPPGNRP